MISLGVELVAMAVDSILTSVLHLADFVSNNLADF